jgi:hypothetical protein
MINLSYGIIPQEIDYTGFILSTANKSLITNATSGIKYTAPSNLSSGILSISQSGLYSAADYADVLTGDARMIDGDLDTALSTSATKSNQGIINNGILIDAQRLVSWIAYVGGWGYQPASGFRVFAGNNIAGGWTEIYPSASGGTGGGVAALTFDIDACASGFKTYMHQNNAPNRIETSEFQVYGKPKYYYMLDLGEIYQVSGVVYSTNTNASGNIAISGSLDNLSYDPIYPITWTSGTSIEYVVNSEIRYLKVSHNNMEASETISISVSGDATRVDFGASGTITSQTLTSSPIGQYGNPEEVIIYNNGPQASGVSCHIYADGTEGSRMMQIASGTNGPWYNNCLNNDAINNRCLGNSINYGGVNCNSYCKFGAMASTSGKLIPVMGLGYTDSQPSGIVILTEYPGIIDGNIAVPVILAAPNDGWQMGVDLGKEFTVNMVRMWHSGINISSNVFSFMYSHDNYNWKYLYEWPTNAFTMGNYKQLILPSSILARYIKQVYDWDLGGCTEFEVWTSGISASEYEEGILNMPSSVLPSGSTLSIYSRTAIPSGYSNMDRNGKIACDLSF